MNKKLSIYIGRNPVRYKDENRHRVLRVIENSRRHLADQSAINYGVSYSKDYYAVITSPFLKVSLDIEKECCTEISFNENVRYMQDRKLWVIKECAAKFCRLGIKAILKNTKVDFISRSKKYELWRVKLDDKWNEGDIFVIYRFLGKKVHLSFSLSRDFL